MSRHENRQARRHGQGRHVKPGPGGDPVHGLGNRPRTRPVGHVLPQVQVGDYQEDEPDGQELGLAAAGPRRGFFRIHRADPSRQPAQGHGDADAIEQPRRLLEDAVPVRHVTAGHLHEIEHRRSGETDTADEPRDQRGARDFGKTPPSPSQDDLPIQD